MSPERARRTFLLLFFFTGCSSQPIDVPPLDDAGSLDASASPDAASLPDAHTPLPACGDGVVDEGELCDGDCPTSCDDGIACTADTLEGSAERCSARCASSAIGACGNGDGCCAPGCDAATDDDCSASCGDGVVDEGEVCDGDCPTSCNDGIACTTDTLVGSADSCSASCSAVAISACVGGDGCCAPGCDALTDTDCSASCGNGVIEGSEICDGACPTSCNDAVACTTDTLVGSAETCSASCSHVSVTACASGDGCCAPGCNSVSDTDCSPSCGNGVIEGSEICDGACPTSCNDAIACTTDTLVGSAASCSASCSHATVTACVGGDGCCAPGCNAVTDTDCSPSCGNGVIEGSEICDGACPTSCNDAVACTTDTLVGSALTCSASCSHAAVTACTSGDGCCAPGCNAVTDTDCSPSCGNGVIEGAEVCDGACPTSCDDGVACTIDTLAGSAASCSATCSHVETDRCHPFWVPITLYRASAYYLALADANASTPTQIELTPGTAAVVSPSGHWLAYGNADELVIVDITADAPVAEAFTSILPMGEAVSTIVFSPDERSIAFETAFGSSMGPGRAIYVGDIAARTFRALPSGGSASVSDAFAWTTDSARLYYVSSARTACTVLRASPTSSTCVTGGAGSVVGGVYAVGRYGVFSWGTSSLQNALTAWSPGVGVVRIDSGSGGRVTQPRTSSDGSAFAFIQQSDTARQAYVSDFTTFPTGVATLAHTSFAGTSRQVVNLLWAPASRRLAMLADFDGSGTNEIFLADWTTASRTTRSLLSSMPSFASVAIDTLRWAPDDSGIAFVGDLSVDGQNELHFGQRVARTWARLHPTLTTGSVVTRPTFYSPTGLYTTVTTAGVTTGYVTETSGAAGWALITPPVSAGLAGQNGSFAVLPGDTRAASVGWMRRSLGDAFVVDPATRTFSWLSEPDTDQVNGIVRR